MDSDRIPLPGVGIAWPFTGYERVAESLERWLGDDEAAYRALRRATWAVTEKIHGANFCVVTDGVEIRGAKRKAFLEPGEDFFGHRDVLRRISGAVRALFALALARDPRVLRVFIYGELFGGGYPHPAVAPAPSVEPIQTGCFYCPTIEFCAFDLATLREGAGEREYVDYDDAVGLFESAGLFYAKPLFRGSYEDAIQFPLGFESHVPALFHLPPIAGNKAEGIVLKPTRAVSVPRRGTPIRPVIKRKIPEFSEDARFHQAQKWAARPALDPDAATAFAILCDEISALVTETRLDAAVSKVGRIRSGEDEKIPEVLALLIEDLKTEIGERQAERVRALSAAQAAELARFVEAEARALVDLVLGELR